MFYRILGETNWQQFHCFKANVGVFLVFDTPKSESLTVFLAVAQVRTQPGLGQRGTGGRTARQECHVGRAAVPGRSRIRGGQLLAVRGVDVALSQARTDRQTISGTTLIDNVHG